MAISISAIVPATPSDGKVSYSLSLSLSFSHRFSVFELTDSFYRKGENVSTNEVEAVIQKVVKLSDCVVFGVAIQHCDGKCGMAVIADPNRTIELDTLYRELTKRLPAFAIPLFVRITSKIELTGSFKLSKTNLEKEGFDPKRVSGGDPLYFLDRKVGAYVPLDAALYDDIQSGRLML